MMTKVSLFDTVKHGGSVLSLAKHENLMLSSSSDSKVHVCIIEQYGRGTTIKVRRIYSIGIDCWVTAIVAGKVDGSRVPPGSSLKLINIRPKNLFPQISLCDAKGYVHLYDLKKNLDEHWEFEKHGKLRLHKQAISKATIACDENRLYTVSHDGFVRVE